ncbi:MAG: hypothetical protein WBQ26_00150 [Gemmatimonadaceae bacterium]
MSSKRRAINDGIDSMAEAANRTAAKISDAKDRAADAASEHAYAAGKRLKRAGEMVMKKAAGR